MENLPIIFQGPSLLPFYGSIISQALEPLLDPLQLARRVGKRVWRLSQEVLWVQPRSGIQHFCSHAVVQNPGFWPELRSTLLRGRLVSGVQLHAQEIEEISFGLQVFPEGSSEMCLR